MVGLDAKRRRLLGVLGAGAAGLAGLATIGFVSANNGASSTAAPLRAFAGPRAWLNSAPLSATELAGKVVLVNFWTYSCINSLRTLPYLREWARKYHDRGLIVIGVHAPEFEFEHDLGRVRRACATLGVAYPVVLDNDYAIWRAFDNEAWPGFFFVDRQGQVRHRMFGEGQYDQSERWLQTLLAENGARVDDAIVDIAGEGAQAAPDWDDQQSPETYVGYAKASNFASWGGLRENAVAAYRPTSELTLNRWSLSGSWRVGSEYATASAPGAAIRFRFHARDLHMVLGRAPEAHTVRMHVTIDGAAPGAHHGVDTDASGAGTLDEDRMYQLVRQQGRIESRVFEAAFLDPGARAYVFTFG